MTPVHVLQRIGDLTDGGLGTGGGDGQRHQVVAQAVLAGPGGISCGAGQFAERGLHRCLVPFGAQLRQFGQLLGPHPDILDLEHLDVGVLVDLVFVDADHRLLPGVDAGLGPGGGFLDPQLGDAVADGLGHPAPLGHLGDVGAGPFGELMSQPLHVVRTAPRVDRPSGAGLLLQQELGVAGDPGREVGRQRQRLVEGIGVQRLSVSLSGGHRLDAGASDVVERILRGQRPARGLRMCAQRKGFGALGAEPRDQFAPQQPAGPKFGHLHEEVHPDAPEERQPRRELVDVQAGVQAGFEVVDTVGQRVGQLQIGCGTGFLDVIAGNRDGVELRHLGTGVGEDVGDDPHGGLRRIDIGVADHELLEDVVLDGPGQLLRRHALLLGGHHIEGQNRQHRSVHGHRHRDLAQVDAVEKLAHVQDRVDGHPRHADVALHAGMVGVVATVGGQVEGDRQALLTGSQVAAVEGIGIRSGGEAGILADGPRLVDVHGRIGPAHERRFAGHTVQRIAGPDRGLPVSLGVERLDHDALGGRPVELFGGVPVRGGRCRDPLGCRGRGRGAGTGAGGTVQGNVGEAGDRRDDAGAFGDLGTCHGHAPNRVSSAESASTASILAVR